MPRILGKRRYSSSDASVSKRYKVSKGASIAKALRATEEIKYYDSTSTVGTPVAISANTIATGNCSQVSAVGLGTGDAARIGRRVAAKYAECRFNIYQSYTGTNATVRCMLYIDTQNAGSVPLTTDVLEWAGVLSPPNTDNKGRFKILRDQLFQVNGTYADSNNMSQVWYVDIEKALKKLYKNPRDALIQFNGDTAGAAATNGKNAVFFVWMSDVAIASSMGTGQARSGIDYATRFAFTDA